MMYDRFAQTILSWDLQAHPNICMIYLEYNSSGAISDAQGRYFDCQGCITLCYQTLAVQEENIREKNKPGCNISVAQAMVPNYRDYIIGELTQAQTQELALRDDWCVTYGVPPVGKDGTGQILYDGGKLDVLCEQECIRVAQKLHQEGILTEKFGRPLPIIIEAPDYAPSPDSGPVAATRAANPPDLSHFYEEWMLRRSYAQLNAYTDLLAEIKTRPSGEQAVIWAEALKAMILERASPMVDRLQELARTEFDVQDELAAVGSEAISAVITLIERYSLQPARRPIRPEEEDEESEFTRKVIERMRAKNPKWGRPRTVPTQEGNLVSAANRVIFEIGTADDAEVERLFAVLKEHFAKNIDILEAGGNVWQIAGRLHNLRPDRFPAAQSPLTNYAAFGLALPHEPGL